MPIPDFQSFMQPMLAFAADGAEHSLTQAREALAEAFRLSQEERSELLPSGRQSRFNNRVAWAKVYLGMAGLVSSARRGHFAITDRGRALLATTPQRIDIPLLEQYEEFRQFRAGSRRADSSGSGDTPNPEEQTVTPEEHLEQSYQTIRSELASELLFRVQGSSPQFFETLVVELLLKMGYGRNRADAGRALGRSGDEGIDGIISEDRLGLDTIYIQAKRWTGTVGRPEIQRFVGALHGKRAHKGVFLTTGSFSAEAHQYVSLIDPRVVLIDGRELAEYMLDLNLGVTTKAVYELKRVDSDYFSEE
jgi:restriction system protein